MKIPWQVDVLVVAVALALRIISPDAATVGYVILGGYATIGRAQAIYSLVLSWVFASLNPGLFPVMENGVLMRYVVFTAAVGSIFVRAPFGRHTKRDRIVVGTVLLGCFLIAHSVAFSGHRQLSLLRSLLWGATMTAIVVGWEDLTPEARSILIRRVVRTLIAVAVASIPLTVIPSGYFLNQRGFQGILDHPQAFGIAMALLGSFAVAAWLLDRRPGSGLAVLTLAVGMVVLSEARTGGFALAIGAVGMAVVRGREGIVEVVRNLLKARTLLLIVCLGSVVTLVGGLYQFVQKYARTESEGRSVVELYYQTRSVIFVPMLRNIIREPLTGIGFGLPSDANAISRAETVLGVPVSLAVEKGVMPLAVLEEIGIIGFVAVTTWLWMGFRRSRQRGAVAVTVVVTILAVNLGEYIMFSPGGAGILFLVVLGWAFTGVCGRQMGDRGGSVSK